jgi:two-component system, OmpR family, sensor histidine kinase CiaH
MFKRTRLKLTGWYMLTTMIVSISFSLALYSLVSREIYRFDQMQRDRIGRRIILDGQRFIQQSPLLAVDPELINEVRRRLILGLIMVNITIVVAAGGLGWLVAGKTLYPIQEMVEDQRRFVSDASHELKTPLTILKTNLEVAARDKSLTASTARTTFRENITHIDRLEKLITRLLKLAQTQELPLSQSYQSSPLHAPINQAISSLSPLAEQKKIKIKLVGTNPILSLPTYELTDLVTILLENAIKYSPTKKEIMITTSKRRTSTKIVVADQGPGIPAAELPLIFNRFYRSDKARTSSNQNGHGLGLAIAKKIAQKHHWQLHVRSTVGSGTQFTLTLS